MQISRNEFTKEVTILLDVEEAKVIKDVLIHGRYQTETSKVKLVNKTIEDLEFVLA